MGLKRTVQRKLRWVISSTVEWGKSEHIFNFEVNLKIVFSCLIKVFLQKVCMKDSTSESNIKTHGIVNSNTIFCSKSEVFGFRQV
jgi:hypothetical protein